MTVNTDKAFLYRLEIMDEMRQGECWRMRNPDTGEVYYAKTATPPEVEMTMKAASLPSDPNAVLQIVKPVTTSRNHVPEAIEKLYPFTDKRSGFILTKSAPLGDALGHLYIKPTDPEDYERHNRWKAKPISAAEYDQFLGEVREMNKMGVYNHDVLSNTNVTRDPSTGKLKIYAFDFEPHTFNPLHPGELEDYAQMIDSGKRFMDNDLMGQGAGQMLVKHTAISEATGAGQAARSAIQEADTTKAIVTGDDVATPPKLNSNIKPATDLPPTSTIKPSSGISGFLKNIKSAVGRSL